MANYYIPINFLLNIQDVVWMADFTPWQLNKTYVSSWILPIRSIM